MAVYAITGKLGAGKGKCGMYKLREYLREGKRIATNCDVFLEHFGDDRSKATIIRVPDKPSATDLYAIGSGNRFIEVERNIQYTEDGGYKGLPPVNPPVMLDGFDESHNGALILDECASWINTRSFAEKGRAELLEYMIHARKYGWDVFFIMQNINQADKQLREALFEYVVRLTRLDRMRVPLVSTALSAVTAGAVAGNLPRVHVAVVRMGSNPDALVADRWIFRGDDLNRVYNTTQVFSDVYPHAIHSLLSAWHLSARVGVPADFVGPIRPGGLDKVLLKPRVEPLKPPHPHMVKFLVLSLLLGVGLGVAGSFVLGLNAADPAPKTSPVQAIAKIEGKPPLGLGFLRTASDVTIILEDGRVVVPTAFTANSKGEWKATIEGGFQVSGVQP